MQLLRGDVHLSQELEHGRPSPAHNVVRWHTQPFVFPRFMRDAVVGLEVEVDDGEFVVV